VHVAVEARDDGGVEISLESRVKFNYGGAILEQTRGVLAELGVKHARVAIHDEGALPFTIAARIEAAARRAGIAPGKRSLPAQHPLPASSPKERLRRSRLYLPGSEPKYYINASLHAPDAVILDLEDSVHRGEKNAARILVLCGQLISDRASAWFASTSCRWGSRIWRKSSARAPI
jgi:citrate lyase subunit beta/citryl-CoA lyase